MRGFPFYLFIIIIFFTNSWLSDPEKGLKNGRVLTATVNFLWANETAPPKSVLVVGKNKHVGKNEHSYCICPFLF